MYVCACVRACVRACVVGVRAGAVARGLRVVALVGAAGEAMAAEVAAAAGASVAVVHWADVARAGGGDGGMHNRIGGGGGGGGGDVLLAVRGPPMGHALSEGAPAVIIFTSGSTGVPKGASMSARAVRARASPHMFWW